METKEYFESVMQDFNQNRNGRSLRMYCTDNGVDYKWLSDYKKTYSSSKRKAGGFKTCIQPAGRDRREDGNLRGRKAGDLESIPSDPGLAFGRAGRDTEY
jgi:hypothetical protein